MTTQEVIDTIRCAIGEVEWNYPLDYAIAFERAIEALQAQNWISAEKMLPEGKRIVLVRAWHETREGAGWWSDFGKYIHNVGWDVNNRLAKVSHWMYIPKLQEENEK
jgi:hypothetical protein